MTPPKDKDSFAFNNLQTKWLEALESDEYRQAHYQLGDPKYGLCCLGLLCLLAGDDFDPDDSYPVRDWQHNYFEYGGVIDGNDLAELNDLRGLTFPEIAKEVRANPGSYLSLREDHPNLTTK